MSESKLRELRHKWIVFYSVFLFFLATLIVLFVSAYFFDNNAQFLYLVMLLLIVFGYAALNLSKVLKVKIPRYRLIKVLRCEKCGYIKVSRPVRGDYIFKKEDKCPKCNSPMTIIKIYRESIPK